MLSSPRGRVDGCRTLLKDEGITPRRLPGFFGKRRALASVKIEKINCFLVQVRTAPELRPDQPCGWLALAWFAEGFPKRCEAGGGCR